MEIVDTEDMRKTDVEAIHEYGVPGIILMEHAAMAIMGYIREHIAKDSRIMILCGSGNNSGDGFALTRLVVKEGYSHVHIHCSVPYDRMSYDEVVHARIAESYGTEIMRTQDMEMIKPTLDETRVVVDASFGTGLSRNIEGFYDVLTLYLNLLNKHVISIDITSGVNGDTGSIMNCAVQSDVTITFECLKREQLLYPGSSYCKDVIVKNMTLPKVMETSIEHSIHLLDKGTVWASLPRRDARPHKGSSDRVMMVGGSSYVHGAIALAAKAMLQNGAGTLTLFPPDCISETTSMKLEKSMLLPAPLMNGSFFMISVGLLERNLDVYDVTATGSDMGQGEMTQVMIRAMLENDRLYLSDGDTLHEAGKLIELLHRSAVTILTLHPKEVSYLCGCSAKKVLKDPLKCAMELTKRYEDIVLILKDQRTIICRKDDMYMNMASSHALAKGGNGDVLCGALTELYAQGKEALQAAAVAVYVHVCAADELTQRIDVHSIRPGNLIAVLPNTCGKLKR